MILADVAYTRAADLGEALDMLGSGAEPLAGGLDVLARLKAATGGAVHLVDVTGLAELTDTAVPDTANPDTRVGALTRHHDLVTGPLGRGATALLGRAAAHIGDPQVRHRGTVGGSLVSADPTSDLPVALAALDARAEILSRAGRSECAVGEVAAVGTGTTALLAAVRVAPPAPGLTRQIAYRTVRRAALDPGITTVAVVRDSDGTRPGHVRVAVGNLADVPVRAGAAEAAAEAGEPPGAAGGLAADTVAGHPWREDTRASVDFRCHLARVLTTRALADVGLGEGR